MQFSRDDVAGIMTIDELKNVFTNAIIRIIQT